MNKKGDVVYFVFLKTNDGKEIEDMTPCITLKKAINHGVHLAKVNVGVSLNGVNKYSTYIFDKDIYNLIKKYTFMWIGTEV